MVTMVTLLVLEISTLLAEEAVLFHLLEIITVALD
jgi:hypothetical protein